MLTLVTDLRRVEEDDLAERVLRVPRDAEGGLVALDANPVVLRVVQQVVRIVLGGLDASAKLVFLLVEGLARHAGGALLPAHVDGQIGARIGQVGADVGHPDADLHAGREGTACHRSHLLAVAEDRASLARDARAR